MKAVLSFRLPDEYEEHRLALHGGEFYAVLSDYDNWLRSLDKYDNRDSITIEEAREKLRELVNQYGVWL